MADSFATRLRAGEPLAGVWSVIGHPAVAELLAAAGFDFVVLDGLDGLFVGPADLSARLGAFGQFESDRVLDAVERTVTAASAADVPVGTLATSLDSIDRRHEWGVDFVAAGTDVGFLREGAGEYLARYRQVRE